MNLIFWKAMPLLDWLVKPLLLTYLIGFGIPSAAMLLAALRLYEKEGNPWTRQAFRERFRLHEISRTVWLWSLGLAAFLFLINLLPGPVELFQQHVISPPKFWIRMMDADPNYFMEVPMRGNWWLVFCLAFFVVFDVVSQELWWRGTIFPRQEAVAAGSTWWMHGLLWSLYQAFLIWDFPKTLLGSLAVSYVCGRLRSTWPTILSRSMISLLRLIGLIEGVLK